MRETVTATATVVVAFVSLRAFANFTGAMLTPADMHTDADTKVEVREANATEDAAVKGNMIPVYVTSFNNLTYVRHMVNMLLEHRVTNDIRILDNASCSVPLLEYLATVTSVHPEVSVTHMGTNRGHLAFEWVSKPKQFVVTDPDLHFNPAMPPNLLETLVAVAREFNAEKVGLALDVSNPAAFKPGIYCQGRTIAGWEAQLWTTPLPNAMGLDLYLAGIDTTFALYTPANTASKHIRIAGPYTCAHLPWYVDTCLPPGAPRVPAEERALYMLTSVCSTTARMEGSGRFYRKTCERHGNTFVLAAHAECSASVAFLNDGFATDWDLGAFDALRRLLLPSKTFVDIGAWIGPLAFYAAKLCTAVVCIEPNIAALDCLRDGIAANRLRNVRVLAKALVPSDVTERVPIAARAAAPDGGSLEMGGPTFDCGPAYADPVTVESLVADGAFERAGFVNVDIEGAEQRVFKELVTTCARFHMPLRIVAYPSLWTCGAEDLTFADAVEFAARFFTRVSSVDAPAKVALLFEHD